MFFQHFYFGAASLSAFLFYHFLICLSHPLHNDYVEYFTTVVLYIMYWVNFVYPEDFTSCASWAGKVLAKFSDASKAASEKPAAKLVDEQLSTNEMERRIKLLREDR